MASLDKSRDAEGEVGNDSGLACTGSIELRLCEITKQLKINVQVKLAATREEGKLSVNLISRQRQIVSPCYLQN
jgi:hypothetical protein